MLEELSSEIVGWLGSSLNVSGESRRVQVRLGEIRLDGIVQAWGSEEKLRQLIFEDMSCRIFRYNFI